MDRRIHWPAHNRVARRILAKAIVPLPIPRRPDRPRDKATPAIGADIGEDAVDTGGAKRAFVAANTGIQTVGWQRPSAIFASGSYFKHGKKYFKTRGVIGRRKTPWTGDTTNQALVA